MQKNFYAKLSETLGWFQHEGSLQLSASLSLCPFLNTDALDSRAYIFT